MIGIAIAATVAAGVATATYFGPFIIATCVGVVTTVGAAVGAYFAGAAARKQETEELNRLRKKLLKREKKVRESASKLAKDTAEHVDILLQQSKENLEQIDSNVGKIEAVVLEVEKTSTSLNTTADALSQATHQSGSEIKAMSIELHALSLEITSLNKKLKLSQEALHDKEKKLNDTLTLLSTKALLFENATKASTDTIDELNRQLTAVQDVLIPADTHEPMMKEADFDSLRAENTRMHQQIQTLEVTIHRMVKTLESTSKTNTSQVDEIKILHAENIRLHGAIIALSKAMEAKTHTANTTQTSRSPRMFHS